MPSRAWNVAILFSTEEEFQKDAKESAVPKNEPTLETLAEKPPLAAATRKSTINIFKYFFLKKKSIFIDLKTKLSYRHQNET